MSTPVYARRTAHRLGPPRNLIVYVCHSSVIGTSKVTHTNICLYGCGQKPWYGSFRGAVRVIQTLWIRALIQALWIKPTSHLIQAPDMNTSAWWHFTPPLSHQLTVKVVASQIKAILFVASLF